jgi:hypothetical protein
MIELIKAFAEFDTDVQGTLVLILIIFWIGVVHTIRAIREKN